MIRTLPALFALLFTAPLMAAPAGQQTLFNFVRPADVVKVATQDASLIGQPASKAIDAELLNQLKQSSNNQPINFCWHYIVAIISHYR